LPSLADILAHKKMQKFTENPILLILSPDSKEAKENNKLPFFLYEQDSQTH
jgi:hypothetical protein